MSNLDYGDPVYVEELPPTSGKGGRQSNAPAMEAWLAKISPGKTAELPSKDEDGAHPVSRVTQMRKVAGTAFKIETRPVVGGKRYRIFATVNATPEAAKAEAPKADAAKK